MSTSVLALGLLIAASLVSAHGLIASAVGDLRGKEQEPGVVSGGVNSQADVTVFNGKSAFGETQGGGNIVVATALAAQRKLLGNTIPQISANAGILTMVFHQINGDGAGPVVSSISTDVTGKTFTDITVSKNVPGTSGKSNAANQDFPLVANIPAGTSCTGTVGALKNMYAVTCANPAGSFGGTVLIQIATAGKRREVIGGNLAARVKAIIEQGRLGACRIR